MYNHSHLYSHQLPQEISWGCVVRSKPFLILISAAVFSSAANAQSVPPPPSSPSTTSTPVLRVSSRVVQLNVIVQDKDGQPVTDLTKNDFTILDQGRPERISSFVLQTDQMTATASPKSAENEFSNRFLEGDGKSSITTVILLDAANTAPRSSDFVQAKAQVIKFAKQMKPGDLRCALLRHFFEVPSPP